MCLVEIYKREREREREREAAGGAGVTSKVIMEVILVLFFVGKHIFRVMAAGDEAS